MLPVSGFDARAVLGETAHRPWPLPAGRWAFRMSWLDLLFLHWPVPAAALRPLLPRGLTLDTFDGEAWLGVVPFRMKGVAPRWLPAVPGLSDFPELNVRTYVTAGGKPGVWFFSLDAANRVAVRLARRFFHLPYFDAEMTCAPEGEGVVYASRRTHRGAPEAVFRARYRPVGPVFTAEAGGLTAWFTERYALYAADGRGRVLRGDVHHAPWPLQPAEVEIEADTLTRSLGLTRTGRPLAHFAQRIDVVAWLNEAG